MRDDRIPEGVDAQRNKRAHHRIGRWNEKTEDERDGVSEGYLQELTESRLCATWPSGSMPRMSGPVTGFGCRPITTLSDAIRAHHGPAFESRQGRKARGAGHTRLSGLYGNWLAPIAQCGACEAGSSAANER